MRPAIRARVALPALAGLTAGLVLGGCTLGEQTQAHRDHERIRGNPTPELDTLYQRPDDVDNAWTIMDNENSRMMMQDLGRVFYTDRPSRLTREPIPW